jgi:hypothetical protein
VSLEQVNAALETLKENKEIIVKLSVKLRDYRDVFSLKKAKKLPPHRLYNHDIKLKDS